MKTEIVLSALLFIFGSQGMAALTDNDPLYAIGRGTELTFVSEIAVIKEDINSTETPLLLFRSDGAIRAITSERIYGAAPNGNYCYFMLNKETFNVSRTLPAKLAVRVTKVSTGLVYENAAVGLNLNSKHIQQLVCVKATGKWNQMTIGEFKKLMEQFVRINVNEEGLF